MGFCMQRPIAAAALWLLSGIAQAQPAVVTPLLETDLADLPGKEAVMLTVEYAPGGADRVHRHNAHAFIYVLEGTVTMQVKGKAAVQLTPGQSFYEAPDDIHLVGRNASTTAPAKFLVLFVKNKGAPRVIPVE